MWPCIWFNFVRPWDERERYICRWIGVRYSERIGVPSRGTGFVPCTFTADECVSLVVTWLRTVTKIQLLPRWTDVVDVACNSVPACVAAPGVQRFMPLFIIARYPTRPSYVFCKDMVKRPTTSQSTCIVCLTGVCPHSTCVEFMSNDMHFNNTYAICLIKSVEWLYLYFVWPYATDTT